MRAALLALLLLAAAALGQSERYRASGTVVAVDRDLGRVTIDTNPIEELKLPALGLAFIVHDGNLLDRMRYGEVTDFIDVYWRTHHWPAFNVADSSITLAVVAVVVQALFFAKSERRPVAQC